MSYKFKTTPAFRKALGRLSASQKVSAKRAFTIFRIDPFDSRLKTHKIQHLSSVYKKTIYSVRIEGDLRSIFFLEGENVISLDIGSHSIYLS